MKILKAIGNFFVKIWRWIKNTAWVQPLLIVGAIFGVIFSIPAITTGIQNAINSKNSADTFYSGYQKSMDGGATSAAERLMNNFYNKSKAEDEGKGESYKLDDSEMKYFILFTAKNNSTASDIKPGFQKLRDSWNDFAPVGNYPFRLYTIYTDETTTETTKTQSAFAQFMTRQSWFFEKASQAGQETQYYIKNPSIKSDLVKLADCDASNFVTPTIMLVDWTKTVTPDKAGITEVFFNVTGANSVAKAEFLSDAWNYRKEFKEN